MHPLGDHGHRGGRRSARRGHPGRPAPDEPESGAFYATQGARALSALLSDPSPRTASEARMPWRTYSQRCRQRGRRPSTSVDRSNSRPTAADAGRALARNSKTEGPGFESFRPCQFLQHRRVPLDGASFTK